MSIIVALYHQRVTQNWCFEWDFMWSFKYSVNLYIYDANDSCKDQLDKQQRVKAGSCHLAFLVPDEDSFCLVEALGK